MNHLKKTNIAIKFIDKHPVVNHNEFNEFYIKNLFDKLSKENKTVFLHGGFNINKPQINSLISCLLLYFYSICFNQQEREVTSKF